MSSERNRGGALKFCRQGQHAVIPLFVKGGIVRGDDIDFFDTSNLFYPNSQLNFNAPGRGRLECKFQFSKGRQPTAGRLRAVFRTGTPEVVAEARKRFGVPVAHHRHYGRRRNRPEVDCLPVVCLPTVKFAIALRCPLASASRRVTMGCSLGSRCSFGAF